MQTETLKTKTLAQKMILELNIKSKKDLDKYLKTLKLGEYVGCSVTSKKDNFDLKKVLDELIQIPNLQVIPTFSCKANYNQNASNTFNKFLNFIDIVKSCGINQILLVSGNPRMKLETLEVLNLIDTKNYPDRILKLAQGDNLDKFNIKVAVVYNPYSQNIKLENQRLEQKLKSSNVNQVWLQLGQDFDKVKVAIEYIRSINPEIKIVNSILKPNLQLLKNLKFRPWSGVYYTAQFYNDLSFALYNVDKMKHLSQNISIEILISGM